MLSVAAAVLIIGGGATTAARADDINLLPNGDFEGLTGTGSLAGWKATTSSTLSLADDGVGGGYAGKATDTTGAGYGMTATPAPVLATVQGTLYTAGGEIRSDTPGGRVCLQLTERSAAGTTVGSIQKCLTTTSAWAALPTVSYVAQQTGSSIGYVVHQTAATTGQSFEADDLTLNAVTPTPPVVVADWQMDETSGNTMYDSAGSNNGTLVNGVTLGNPGFAGTAYGFNGSTTKSYVAVPDAPDLNPGAGDFSFQIDVNTTSLPTSGDYDIIRKGSYTAAVASNEFKMELQQSGQASCSLRGTAGKVEIIAGPNVADGQWHTIECARTPTAVVLTVDGQAFSKAAQVGSISNTSPLVIGAHPGSDFYRGLLDEASLTEGG